MLPSGCYLNECPYWTRYPVTGINCTEKKERNAKIKQRRQKKRKWEKRTGVKVRVKGELFFGLLDARQKDENKVKDREDPALCHIHGKNAFPIHTLRLCLMENKGRVSLVHSGSPELARLSLLC